MHLEIILFKVVNILPPEYRIFVHRGPIKMPEKDLLLVFVERT